MKELQEHSSTRQAVMFVKSASGAESVVLGVQELSADAAQAV